MFDHTDPAYGPIPSHLVRSLDRYAREGVATGDFLYCVLTNDLAGAVGRAVPVGMGGEITFDVLRGLVMYVHHELPAGCHGSAGNVERWIEKARMGRLPAGLGKGGGDAAD